MRCWWDKETASHVTRSFFIIYCAVLEGRDNQSHSDKGVIRANQVIFHPSTKSPLLDILLMGLFVMPRLVGRARFQGTEDVHQAGLGAAPFEERVNAVFLAKGFLADKFDL